jgi:hypothetical protein
VNLVAPLFLAGLACAALPWLLHRFSHEDPEQQAFPSTRFLEAVPPPVSQRRRLKYWMLLALRCLAIVLLCLAFARPWFDSTGSDAASESLHLVVVDRSLSMQVDARFESAVDQARELVDTLPDGDPVRLFVADNRLVELSSEDRSADAALAELGSVSVSDARADAGALMRRLDVFASTERLPVRAHFITDVQSSALPVRRNELLAPSLSQFEVIPVGESTPFNAALSASAFSADGALMRVLVTLQAYGGASDSIREFVIRHEGTELVRESVTLSDGALVERQFDDLPLPAGEWPVLNIEFTEGDALANDDAVQVAVRQGGQRRVVMAGFSQAIPDTPEVFLRAALQTGANARVEDAPASARTLPEDARHAIVFMAPDDEQAMTALRRQTDRGVNVLLIPTVNRAGFASNAGGERAARVAKIDEAHPAALGELSWSGVRLYGDTRFAAEPNDRTLVASSDGVPLLVERASSSGRLVILNDLLDGQTSNLPYEPVFVDFISRVVEWFDAAGAIPEQLFVGEPLVLPARTQVFAPDGSALAGLEQTSNGVELDLDERGIYRVLDSRGERYVHVVLDPRESDLGVMADDERLSWQARHDNNQVQADNSESEPATQRPAPEPTYQALWQWLLFFTLVVVIVESLVGNRHLAVRRDGS